MQKYLYLPRLKSRAVFEQAIVTGASGRDFFGIAYGQAGEKLEGFRLGRGAVQLDDTLLLVEPAAAAAYAAAEDARAAAEAAQRAAATQTETGATSQSRPPPRPITGAGATTASTASTSCARSANAPAARAKAFFGTVDVNASTARMKLVSIAEEIIAVLAADPNASVKVTVEVSADFPNGASDQTKRAVTENATALGFRSKNWE